MNADAQLVFLVDLFIASGILQNVPARNQGLNSLSLASLDLCSEVSFPGNSKSTQVGMKIGCYGSQSEDASPLKLT